MKWEYQGSLGVPELDERLNRAFERFALVKRTQAEGGCWNDVHFELATLSAELELCFTVEEALMRIHDYPDRERHSQEHAELLQSVQALERATLTTGLTGKMIGAAFAATMGHHLTQDRRYVRHLSKSKMSPGR